MNSNNLWRYTEPMMTTKENLSKPEHSLQVECLRLKRKDATLSYITEQAPQLHITYLSNHCFKTFIKHLKYVRKSGCHPE